jgi:hypothetical protein
MKLKLGIFPFSLLLALIPVLAEARDRCGWIENMDASTWYFKDTERRWVIADRNGYEAAGFEKIGDLYSAEYMPLAKYYGYACSCISGSTSEDGKLEEIYSFKYMPISQCEAMEDLTVTGDD